MSKQGYDRRASKEVAPIIVKYLEKEVNRNFDLTVVSGMLPINDEQIRAYGLLQLISKAEITEPSPYEPENDIRKRNIAKWKKEYYALIGNFR